MIFFLPWVVLMLAVVIAVPVAAKMSPSAYSGNGLADDAEMADENGEVAEIAADDFGGEPLGEPIGDDAFADLNQ